MQDKFTIEEIKNYIKSRYSLGDVFYFCTAENIRKANEPEEEDLEDSADDDFDIRKLK